MRGWKPVAALAAATALVMTLALVGCGGASTAPSTSAPAGGSTAETPSPAGGSGSGTSATITEQGFAFNPSTLEVKVGDTVTFTNQDSAKHFVRIDGKDLAEQGQGDSVTWTAEKAGTYPYTCPIHPSMKGEIIVK